MNMLLQKSTGEQDMDKELLEEWHQNYPGCDFHIVLRQARIVQAITIALVDTADLGSSRIGDPDFVIRGFPECSWLFRQGLRRIS